VRITGTPEWETDPDFALLAVMRVMAGSVCYQPIKWGEKENDNVNDYLCQTTAELAADLEDLGCQRQ
jgi:hypothetical protein